MTIQVTLRLGPIVPAPAPAEITGALSRVEVTQTDQAPSTFQLTFSTSKTSSGQDYGLAAHPLLKEFNRVVLVANVDHSPTFLIDGFITHRELDLQGQTAHLTVTGEDVSVKMDMVTIPMSYPDMPDFVIVGLVLAKYALLGVIPEVIPPILEAPLIETTPQQVGTDRAFVQNLACRYGHLFFVSPVLTPGVNTAYWGPPDLIRLEAPQAPIAIHAGPSTNCESLTANYNGLAPQISFGIDLIEAVPVPFAGLLYTRPPLAANPPEFSLFAPLATNPLSFVEKLATLAMRVELIKHEGMSWIEAEATAESQTNRSADPTVTVTGELDASRYGAVLTAPGKVGVQGAGESFDGYYYIQSVTHTMDLAYGSLDYKQSFNLTREGTGSTTQEV